MDVRAELYRELSTEELMLLNCGVREDSWSPLDCKEMKSVHSKGNQSFPCPLSLQPVGAGCEVFKG